MKICLLTFIAVCLTSCFSDKSIGSTQIMRGSTNEEIMMNQAVKTCPLESEKPCQVLFIKEDAKAPTTIPLTDEQVNDVLMYFAVDNSLEYDAAELIWNCHVFKSLDEPDTKHPTCITPEMLNKLLTPYHAK